jgi:glycosyltransferase involved in cell wall biosynthesis
MFAVLGRESINPSVSVLVIVRNAEKYIGACISSILNQSFNDFEVIVVDDSSSDNTGKIIATFSDKKIKYFRNEKWLGISPSRNRSVKYAAGEYLFFTDGDCTVSKNWIEEGLKYLEDEDVVGVEGMIIYVSKDYTPTFSDRVLENKAGGNFMTGNIAYKKKVVEMVGGFDESLNYLEDRDIALRIMKHGKICFASEMVVIHPQVILTPKKLIEASANNVNRVLIFKKSGTKEFIVWRIYCPINLAKILFPPLIFSSLLSKKFRNSYDFKLLPYSYIYLICERIHLWKTSISERVFLI